MINYAIRHFHRACQRDDAMAKYCYMEKKSYGIKISPTEIKLTQKLAHGNTYKRV